VPRHRAATSCRDIVRKVQAWWLLRAPKSSAGSSSTAAYTKARQRLEPEAVRSIGEHLIERLERHVPPSQLWLGRRVVDGTTVSMPGTAENQEKYPQPSSQKAGCGFPQMRVVGLFSLASGALLNFAKSSDIGQSITIRRPTLLRGSRDWHSGQRGPQRLSNSRLICAPISSKVTFETTYPLNGAKALMLRTFTPVQGHPDRGGAPAIFKKIRHASATKSQFFHDLISKIAANHAQPQNHSMKTLTSGQGIRCGNSTEIFKLSEIEDRTCCPAFFSSKYSGSLKSKVTS